MKRILVDITAATEYAHKLIEEDALEYAKSNLIPHTKGNWKLLL